MIKGITNIYRPVRQGKIHLGVKLKKGTPSEHPSEVDFFVLKDAPELIPFYGQDPEDPKNPKGIHLSLNVALPSARFEGENFDQYLDKVFPQYLKRYRQSGLMCKGDGETATGLNEDTGAMEERDCPCEYLEKGDCSRMGILRIRIQEIPSFGIYQITTGSFNSIVNINSFIRDLCEFCIVNGVDVSQVRLVLKRTGQQVQRLEGGKVKKSKHHIMSIDLDPRFYKSLDDVRIRALQSRMPPVPKALPPADETKDDLFFQEQGGGFDASEEALRETISGLNEGQKIIDATKAEAKKLGVTIIDEIAKKKPEQKTSGIHDLGTEQGFPEGPPNGEPMKLTQDEPKKVKPKPPDEKAPLRAAFAALVKAGGIIPKDECNKFAGAMTKKDIDYWTKVLNDRTAYLRRIAKG